MATSSPPASTNRRATSTVSRRYRRSENATIRSLERTSESTSTLRTTVPSIRVTCERPALRSKASRDAYEKDLLEPTMNRRRAATIRAAARAIESSARIRSSASAIEARSCSITRCCSRVDDLRCRRASYRSCGLASSRFRARRSSASDIAGLLRRAEEIDRGGGVDPLAGDRDEPLGEQIGERRPDIAADLVGHLWAARGEGSEVGRERQPQVVTVTSWDTPVSFCGFRRRCARRPRLIFLAQVPLDDDAVGAGFAVQVLPEPAAAGTEDVQVEVRVAGLERVVGPAHRGHAVRQRDLTLRALEEPPEAETLLLCGDHCSLGVVVEIQAVRAAEAVGESDQVVCRVQYADDGPAVGHEGAEQAWIERIVGVLIAEDSAVERGRRCELRRGGEGDGTEPVGRALRCHRSPTTKDT